MFESPPVESEPGDQPSSPFNEPLTFYSYPSPHHSLSLTTVKERLTERLGITSRNRFLPDSSHRSQSLTASSRSQPSLPSDRSSDLSKSPPRTVRFLHQPQLTSEQEARSLAHQTALRDTHYQGKSFQSRTSLPPHSARSLDSTTADFPLPQLSFGSITPISGSAEVYISKNII